MFTGPRRRNGKTERLDIRTIVIGMVTTMFAQAAQAAHGKRTGTMLMPQGARGKKNGKSLKGARGKKNAKILKEAAKVKATHHIQPNTLPPGV